MIQMTVGDLKKAIANMPDDLPVYMRAVNNSLGNIVEVGEVKKDTYGFFGMPVPCVIVEVVKE